MSKKQPKTNYCQCGHPQLKHLYGGYGGCNQFKCVCDKYVFDEGKSEFMATVQDGYERLGIELKTEAELKNEITLP